MFGLIKKLKGDNFRVAAKGLPSVAVFMRHKLSQIALLGGNKRRLFIHIVFAVAHCKSRLSGILFGIARSPPCNGSDDSANAMLLKAHHQIIE